MGSNHSPWGHLCQETWSPQPRHPWPSQEEDRKSTRLNSSHLVISYAVFCLKNKKHSQPQRRAFPSPPRRRFYLSAPVVIFPPPPSPPRARLPALTSHIHT